MAYDTINAGAGVDTLVLAGNVTTSATVGQNIIDLSVAADADQVTTVNNAGETVAQANFENVDLSLLTASAAGFAITAAAAGSSIIGSPQVDSIVGGAGNDTINGGDSGDTLLGNGGVDSITGGEGADTITGGAGNDTIALAETTAAIDTVIFSGNTTLALQLTANGVDTITGFGSANDLITLTALGDGTNQASATAVAAGAQSAITNDSTSVISTTGAAANLTTGGTATVSDFTNLTQVAAYLSERLAVTAATSTGVFLINDISGTNTTSYVYSYIDAANAGIQSTELLLVGTITHTAGAALAAANVT